MEDYVVTSKQTLKADDGTVEPYTGKTLVVRWEDELHPVGTKREDGAGDPLRGQQHRALVVLNEIINGRGGTVPPPECEAPPGLKVTRLDTWRLRLIDKTVIEGKNTGAAFSQLKNALLDRGEIDISAGHVWPKLG
jgi:hypothetical protein